MVTTPDISRRLPASNNRHATGHADSGVSQKPGGATSKTSCKKPAFGSPVVWTSSRPARIIRRSVIFRFPVYVRNANVPATGKRNGDTAELLEDRGHEARRKRVAIEAPNKIKKRAPKSRPTLRQKPQPDVEARFVQLDLMNRIYSGMTDAQLHEHAHMHQEMLEKIEAELAKNGKVEGGDDGVKKEQGVVQLGELGDNGCRTEATGEVQSVVELCDQGTQT